LSSPGQARFHQRLTFLFFSATRGMETLWLQLRWLEIHPSSPHHLLSVNWFGLTVLVPKRHLYNGGQKFITFLGLK